MAELNAEGVRFAEKAETAEAISKIGEAEFVITQTPESLKMQA